MKDALYKIGGHKIRGIVDEGAHLINYTRRKNKGSKGF